MVKEKKHSLQYLDYQTNSNFFSFNFGRSHLILNFVFSNLWLTVNENCQWLDSNSIFLVLEATAQPNVPQPLPFLYHYQQLSMSFQRLPVVIFIHGGSFTSGSSTLTSYEPSAIVCRGNIIFVSIQYRVGAFGFLSMGDKSSAKGNAGLVDQGLKLLKLFCWQCDKTTKSFCYHTLIR